MVDAGNRTLEQQIQVAENETEALQEELRQLDENWSTRLAALGLSSGSEMVQRGRAGRRPKLCRIPVLPDAVMQARHRSTGRLPRR